MSGCDEHYKRDQSKVREVERDGGSFLMKIREGLSEEVTFKQRLEGSKEMHSWVFGVIAFQAEEMALRREHPWHIEEQKRGWSSGPRGGRGGRVVKGVVKEEENAPLGGCEQISHVIFLTVSDVPSGCHVGLEA